VTKTPQLSISRKLGGPWLPLSYVTGSAAILGQRNAGKTYKGSVIAEELLIHAQQIVVLDPTSAWWGLRSSSTGKEDGFPITIIGGEHGDLPLDPASGAELARAIVHDRFSVIIDFDGLNKAEEQRFCAPFLDTLYRAKTGEYRTPLHIFMDEADVFAPQRPMGDETRTLGACQTLVRRGRIKGLGITMITQRPAELSKGVLSQVDTLITLRLMHPRDMAQIDEWVAVHGDEKRAKQMMASLPDLPKGEAWIWSPMNKVFERLTFRDRLTFDSGKTPEVGEHVAPPKVLAKVDIDKLGKAMAASVEQAKANDPKALRARIVELERELRAKPSSASAAKVIEVEVDKIVPQIVEIQKIVDRPVISDGDLHSLRGVAAEVSQSVAQINQTIEGVAKLTSLVAVLTSTSTSITDTIKKWIDRRQTASQPAAVQPLAREKKRARTIEGMDPRVKAVLERPVKRGRHPFADNYMSTTRGRNPMGEDMSTAEMRILSSLAWWESIDVNAPSTESVAFLAGYTVNGHFTNMRGKLASAGLITYPRSGTISLTDIGRRKAPASERPHTREALHKAVFDVLDGPKSRILSVLIDAYPAALPAERVAKKAGYTVNGHFTNMRGRLSSLGLITYPKSGEMRASDLLFPEGL